ncbi:MAG: OmpA family protein, partial [Granulosicoccaceae bacterium]
MARPQSLLKAWRCLSAALFAGVIASPAFADLQLPEREDNSVAIALKELSGGGGESAHKYYVGIGGGLSKLEPEDFGDGFSFAEDGDQSEGAKVFFGKYFKPRWRWEVGYTDAGKAEVQNGAQVSEIEHKIPSVAIDYLLRKPSSKLNFYLRGGAALIERESDDTRIEFEDESEVGALLGAGMQWRMGNRLEGRLGLESYGEEAAFAHLSLSAKLGRVASAKPAVAQPSLDKEDMVAPGAVEEPLLVPIERLPDDSEAKTKSDAEVAAPGACKSVDRELSGVTFDSGSAQLSALAKQQLDKVARALTRGPNIRVTVRGYTDSRGNSSKNQMLSQKRARAVANYLAMAAGNFNNPPRAIGMGESNPIASNETASGRARNRRIELNLRAGDGCEDELAGLLEVDSNVGKSLPQGVQSAALQRVEPASVIAEASVHASYKEGLPQCQQIDQVVRGVSFEVGESALDGASKRALLPMIAALRNDSSLLIQIKGHTDSIGRRSANQRLSALRAQSVADYLMSQAPSLSTAPSILGLGEMYPIASNDSVAGRAHNRRIEISMTGGRNCHLPVQQAGAIFKPQAPARAQTQTAISKSKKQSLEALSLTPVQAEIAEDKAASSVARAAAEPEPQIEQESVAAPEQAAEVVAVAAQAGAVQEGIEILDEVSAPVAKALEAEELNPMPFAVVEPIAEPALSDTIELAGQQSPVAASRACNGIDRIISGVQFEAGDTRLNKKARRVLDPVVQLLRRDPAIQVVIEGHTDDVGGARENMELSERRAKAVAAYLAGGAGMVKNPPLAMGFGETRPLYSNADASGRRGNRRIVLKLDGGRGCLSNDMLAGISGLEPIEQPAATLANNPQSKLSPSAAALVDAEQAFAKETFSQVMERMARGHGACGKEAHVVEDIDFRSGDHRLDAADQRALMPLVTLWREN